MSPIEFSKRLFITRTEIFLNQCLVALVAHGLFAPLLMSGRGKVKGLYVAQIWCTEMGSGVN